MDVHSPIADLVLSTSMLLLLASAMLVLARRIRLPFTVLLVLAGMGLTQIAPFLPPAVARLTDLQISPDIILYVFLPSLIFESAFHLDVRQLRDNLLPVLTLAVPGLLISTVVIAALVSAFSAVPFAAALVLGAILSATDPVAVIALFHQLGAPKRLTTLVEGESLFNDATAIVAAKILLAVAVAGYFTPATVGNAVIEFGVVFVGGIVVGWLMALAAGFVLGLVHDNQAIEMSILTTLAYLSFLIGEEVFHVSGVMATVAAGLTIGGWGRSKISPGIADAMEHIWAYIAFVANALIFLLVGLAIEPAALLDSADLIGIAIAAMLASRALVVYGLMPAVGRLPGSEPVSRGYQTVMYWGGLRGAVALAVVLSLGDFVWAEVFIAVVMGAVLFTLIVQGLTIEPLMRRLNLHRPGLGDRLARDEARVEAAIKALTRIPELAASGLFSASVSQGVEARQQQDIEAMRAQITALREAEVDSDAALRMLWRRCLAGERIAYYELYSRHHIDEAMFRRLEHDASRRIDVLRHLGRDGNYALTLSAPDPAHNLSAMVTYLPRALANLIHTHLAGREYIRVWAQIQACDRVEGFIMEMQGVDTVIPALLDEVRGAYLQRRSGLRDRLDSWAQQFPDFVKDMQERLAMRLLLRVERDEIWERVHSGMLPYGLGVELLEELDRRIRVTGKVSYKGLQVEPAELVRKVPFFADLDAVDVEHVLHQLKSLVVAPGEDVIRQCEEGDSMYFIARGVIRVVRSENDKDVELATLLAGDFFGEMALLNREPRTATCRAVTACALHELSRSGVQAASEYCPALRANLRVAADARRR